MLDGVKAIFRDQLGLPAWIVLAGAGLLSHVALTALLRKPLTSPWGLLAPLMLGVAVEGYEIWLQYRHIGLLAPGNDPLWMILGRHVRDVAVMVSLPVLMVMAVQCSSR